MLEHPIPFETREDADAFYATPELLFFVAVANALRNVGKRDKAVRTKLAPKGTVRAFPAAKPVSKSLQS